MSRTTITTTGQVVYRTKLMDLSRANSFARCISSNTRFSDVLVERSERAKSEKNCFVTFQPMSEERKDAIHQAQQDARTHRGETQEFIFWQDPDHINSFWCFSVESGETYQVDLFSCTCPDYVYRCQCAGLTCKHMAAWSKQKREGLIGQTDKQTPQPERAARQARLNANLDF